MKHTIGILNDLQACGVIGEYAIGGAMAAMFYAEPVATYDLDVVAEFPQQDFGLITLDAMYRSLEEMGYEVSGEHIMIEGVPVQLLPVISPLHEEAIARAHTLLVDGVHARVMRPEYLVVIAAQLGRPKDLARIALLQEQANLDHALLEDIATRHGVTLP